MVNIRFAWVVELIDYAKLSKIIKDGYNNDCVEIRTHTITTQKIYPGNPPKIYVSSYSYTEGINQGKQKKKPKQDKQVKTENKGEVDPFAAN